jgi:hypothetical protein
MGHLVYRGAQAEFPEKGKPIVRSGRKAMGLPAGDRQATEGERSLADFDRTFGEAPTVELARPHYPK